MTSQNGPSPSRDFASCTQVTLVTFFSLAVLASARTRLGFKFLSRRRGGTQAFQVGSNDKIVFCARTFVLFRKRGPEGLGNLAQALGLAEAWAKLSRPFGPCPPSRNS